MGEILTVNLPDIGEGVAEGEVIQWLKEVGSPVAQDEPVVVVMTDKATVELPAPRPGKLAKQYYQAGDIAAVEKPLYDLEVEATTPPKTPGGDTEVAQGKAAPGGQRSHGISDKAAPEGQRGSGTLATPKTRQLARELQIDINQVAGTGKDGRVTEQDVKESLRYHGVAHRTSTPSKRAAPFIEKSTPPLHFDDDQETPIAGLRRVVAEKMVESKLIAPHFSYFDQADATRLVQLYNNIKGEAEASGVKLTYMPFFIRALSMSLKSYPQVNGSVDLEQNKLVVHLHHNVGIATRTPDGLVVPVIKNVQEMSFYDVIRKYDALREKTQSGGLGPSDMKDSTITITNFGPLGGRWATPIINYPEIAILGIAKIRKQPVVKDEEVVVRDMLNLSWSFDHRVIDGGLAAQFSNHFISLIENPARLL